METKEIKITPPEGYEIDKENSTFECIKIKKKSLTYEDVARDLFFHKESFSVDNVGIYKNPDTICYQDIIISKTTKQLEKLLAINKLMNVAKYLNGDWKPDWSDEQEVKYSIFIDNYKNVVIDGYVHSNKTIVYFRSRELAQQAINILGKDTIRLASSTDW